MHFHKTSKVHCFKGTFPLTLLLTPLFSHVIYLFVFIDF